MCAQKKNRYDYDCDQEKTKRTVVFYCDCPAQNSANCCCPDDEIDPCCPQHNKKPTPSPTCPLHKHLKVFPKNARYYMIKVKK